jgi:hypothetical protein
MIKRWIIESLPFNQIGKSLGQVYSDVNFTSLDLGRGNVTEEGFLSSLLELKDEQALVIIGEDDIRGTNYGFIKYNCI